MLKKTAPLKLTHKLNTLNILSTFLKQKYGITQKAIIFGFSDIKITPTLRFFFLAPKCVTTYQNAYGYVRHIFSYYKYSL